MKIDSLYTPRTTTVTSRPAQQQTGTAAQEAVSLSTLANSLQEGNNSSQVNTARVQEIKQAISEGRFKVNPEAIADRLIETAQALVGRKSSSQQG